MYIAVRHGQFSGILMNMDMPPSSSDSKCKILFKVFSFRPVNEMSSQASSVSGRMRQIPRKCFL